MAFSSRQDWACIATGDGGSLFSIHAIWTAAKHKIPVIFICFVNQEYQILKELSCKEKGIDFATTQFIGLDFVDPNLDLAAIATGFGAPVVHCNKVDHVQEVLDHALAHRGLTVIFVQRRKSIRRQTRARSRYAGVFLYRYWLAQLPTSTSRKLT